MWLVLTNYSLCNHADNLGQYIDVAPYYTGDILMIIMLYFRIRETVSIVCTLNGNLEFHVALFS